MKNKTKQNKTKQNKTKNIMYNIIPDKKTCTIEKSVILISIVSVIV